MVDTAFERRIDTLPTTSPTGLTAVLFLAANLAIWSFLAMDVFYGPLRVAFYLTGTSILFYVPKLMMVALPLIFAVGVTKVRTASLVTTVTVLYGLIVGMMVFRNPVQVMFGFYMLGTLFFGLLVIRLGLETTVIRASRVFIWIVIGGVFLDYFVTFPWAAATIFISGAETDATRSWNAGSVARLAGFSGASYFVAAQLTSLTTLLLSRPEQKFKAPLFILAFVAVILTTMKGSLLAMLIIGFFYVVRSQALFVLATVLFLAMGILLPVYSYEMHVNATYFNSQAQESNFLGFLTINTLLERMAWMWPMGMEHTINLNGMWGSGIGGMGAPLGRYYDSAFIAAAADSLFVYIRAWFGPLSYVVMIGAGIRAIRLSFHDPMQWFAKILLLSTLAFGVVASPIERPLMLFFAGMALAVAPKPVARARRTTA